MWWPWFVDESQQTVVIAILGFIGAFLLTHYFLSLRSHNTIIRDSNSYDGLIESLLSQVLGKVCSDNKNH